MRPLMLFLLMGCATAGPSSDHVPATDRNRITSEEIESTHTQNAFMLVQQLRPRWLQVQAVTSFQNQRGVALYVEGVHVGDASHLRDYDTADLNELKYLSGADATQLYGIDHTAGAIQLFLKHGR